MPANQPEFQRFLNAVEAWGCDNYSLDIRYLAGLDGNPMHLWDAAIALQPLPPGVDNNLNLNAGSFSAGQIQRHPVKAKEIIQVIKHASEGIIDVHGKQLSMPIERGLDFYTELAQRDRWYADLHLQVSGANRPVISGLELATIDSALRQATPPFDGLSDVLSWFGIPDQVSNGTASTIRIRMAPPVDLIFEKSKLSQGKLLLTLLAHPKFDERRLGLAIRCFPGKGLTGRSLVAKNIKWKKAKGGIREGILSLEVKDADSVLTMLTVGSTTVRRQWFNDADRARNWRLVAVQHFDQDLKMIKHALLSPNAEMFERGVAALLFLLGFSPVVQLETNSPDLIVTTPAGRIVIVECTTRMADFASKMGKLIDRRGSLISALQASEHPANVLAVLVCALPRARIASQIPSVNAHDAVLVAREELEQGFTRVRTPNDPDQMVLDMEAQLRSLKEATKE